MRLCIPLCLREQICKEVGVDVAFDFRKISYRYTGNITLPNSQTKKIRCLGKVHGGLISDLWFAHRVCYSPLLPLMCQKSPIISAKRALSKEPSHQFSPAVLTSPHTLHILSAPPPPSLSPPSAPPPCSVPPLSAAAASVASPEEGGGPPCPFSLSAPVC